MTDPLPPKLDPWSQVRVPLGVREPKLPPFNRRQLLKQQVKRQGPPKPLFHPRRRRLAIALSSYGLTAFAAALILMLIREWLQK